MDQHTYFSPWGPPLTPEQSRCEHPQLEMNGHPAPVNFPVRCEQCKRQFTAPEAERMGVDIIPWD